MTLLRQRAFWLTVLSGALFFATAAQDRREDPGPSGKIIEVHSDGVRPVSKIALRADRSAGFWTSNLPRIKDWKLPAGQEPIQVIDISAQLVGDMAEVKVSTYRGKRFRENVEVIARHMLSEGDSVTIAEVKKFGYEPLTIKMASIATAMADLPLVDNRAQSVRISVTPATATLPTFMVNVANNSIKAVWAFAWHTEAGGRRLVSALPHGQYGKPLIPQNGDYKLSIPATRPESVTNQIKLVINAVVFEDGSVEGDAGVGASFNGMIAGEKVALPRIIPILHTHLAAGKLDLPSLIASVDAIVFRPGGVTHGMVKISHEKTVQETVKALRVLQTVAPTRSDADVREALVEFTEIYEGWLTRLSKYP